VMEEAHLDPGHILEGIRRFAGHRQQRLACMRAELDSLLGP
jgi:hypothetical protein